MASFVLTSWHEKNSNMWVALELTDKPKKGWGQDPNKFILRGREQSLATLTAKVGKKDYTYSRSWMSGVEKDMKIGESRDEYLERKGFKHDPRQICR